MVGVCRILVSLPQMALNPLLDWLNTFSKKKNNNKKLRHNIRQLSEIVDCDTCIRCVYCIN